MTHTCWVCGARNVPLRNRWFQILYYWVQEYICEECCNLSQQDDCGEQSEPWDNTIH